MSPSLTPALGTNSWNFYGCSVNATILVDTAKALVATGLDKKGVSRGPARLLSSCAF